MVIIKKIKKYYQLLFIFFTISFFTLGYEYLNYKEIKKEELYETKVEIINIYKKEKYLVLKLKSSNFEFFTLVEKNASVNKLEHLNIAFLSTKVNFYSYLKGFYAKTIYYEKLTKEQSLRDILAKKIEAQHNQRKITELFQALFLAIPLSKDLREIFSSYSISHLIALSGFHLAVLSFIIYILVYYPYSYIHKSFFPYRNKKYDILLFSLFILFLYLLFTNIVPSLLRAFIMLLLSVFLLRNNIKLFSFYNLFLVLVLIVCLFPRYVFSLGLWFSFFGVFYIFLFIRYFKHIKNRLFQILFFNFWIFFAFNPIIHYFFPVTSYEQLYSPLLTIVFTIFYPLELALHLVSYGSIFDELLLSFINYDIEVYEKGVSVFFVFVYILLSLFAIKSKKSFFLLNCLIFIYNLHLFLIIN